MTYYDGQGFLVNKKLGVKSAKELDGATVCVQAGTTTELNLSDYFRANKMKYTPITYDKSDRAPGPGSRPLRRADIRSVAALRQRIKLAKPRRLCRTAGGHLQGTAGSVVRHGDDDWFDIVKWTLSSWSTPRNSASIPRTSRR